MRWPWPPNSVGPDGGSKDEPEAWPDNYDAPGWSSYTDPRTVVSSIVLSAATWGLYRFYTSRLRRIPNTQYIKPKYYRRRSLFGTVTSVGDGDNFRLFHTPGGRLAGWGWLRRIPKEPRDLANKTVRSRTSRWPRLALITLVLTTSTLQIHIRIAGIDAPELPHFGKEGQPHAKEALQWLTEYILHRRVRAYIHRRDQYDRVVATVSIRRGLFRRDVGLEMLKLGHADVYEAKTGMEFGKHEDKYRRARKEAEEQGRGQWNPSSSRSLLERSGLAPKSAWFRGLLRKSRPEEVRETPREYKARTRQEAEKKKKL